MNIAPISLQDAPRFIKSNRYTMFPSSCTKHGCPSYYITTLKTCTPWMSISPHTFQTNSQSKAFQLSGVDLVQFHNPSVVYAQEYHHGFAQIQESRSPLSLHLPIGTVGG